MKRFRYNPLFRPGAEFWMNACVGENGGPYDFSDYGEGFFKGGFAIIEASQGGKLPIDIMIYPAAFNFRQGIELYLKHFLLELKNLGNNVGSFVASHNLQVNWTAFANAVKISNYEEFTPVKLEVCGASIQHFCEIDEQGQAFRYPEDRKGRKSLIDFSIINADILNDGMQRLHDIFREWHFSLDNRRWQ